MPTKVWFITGASRGFGREWAMAALNRGDRVTATARDVSALDDMKREFGDALFRLELDVTDYAADFSAVSVAYDHFGRLDVVVNNAGYGQYGFVEEVSQREARDQMEVNFFGALWVTQAALPIMRRQRTGHIIQVSSGAGVATAANFGMYSASKFALEAFSEALAQEVEPFGIHVTMVEPGLFATDFSTSIQHAVKLPVYNPRRQQVLQMLDLALGTPGDPAATVPALFEVVDAEKPPLRVVFGPSALTHIKSVYEERLDTWARWERVTVSSQGA
jgi:NAD(P)-dependent dehydrogenase (short-subunit alcohol dehydrogenase family)